jgi:hypothetical protein
MSHYLSLFFACEIMASNFFVLPCCFLAAILYLIQDSSKEAAGKKDVSVHELHLYYESLLPNPQGSVMVSLISLFTSPADNNNAHRC